MRIVSLLPSATEIVFALGLDDELVGVSHACDYPPEARLKPVVSIPSAALAVSEPAAAVASGPGAGPSHVGSASGGWGLDQPAFVAAAPDLVLLQERCGACGQRLGGLGTAVRRLAPDASVVSLEPVSVDGILNAVITVGAMAAAEDEAVGLVEVLRERLGELQERVLRRRDQGHRPLRVVGLERLDPPVAVGGWIPEQVRLAGGWDLLGREHADPAQTTWEDVLAVDPEMLLLAPPGLHVDGAVRAWRSFTRPPFWRELQAVRRGQVFALDGAGHFGRSGPRVMEGIAVLAEIMDPEGFVKDLPPGLWTPVS